MAKLRPTKATHIRVISHTAGPRRQIRAGQVLQVGAGITRDEATRLLAAGMADDASGELVGQDLGLLTAQLKALPEGQLAALLSALGAKGSDATPPTWPSTVGETVADGEVEWITRATHPAPLVLQACAQSVVVLLDEGFLELEPGLVGERDGDYSVRYRATSASNQHAAVNNRVQALLRRFR